MAMADEQPARFALTALWPTTAILDCHVAIPDRLLRLGGRDTTGSELVQSNLRGEQLVDVIRHPPSMTNAGDIWPMRVRTTASHSAKRKGGDSNPRQRLNP